MVRVAQHGDESPLSKFAFVCYCALVKQLPIHVFAVSSVLLTGCPVGLQEPLTLRPNDVKGMNV